MPMIEIGDQVHLHIDPGRPDHDLVVVVAGVLPAAAHPPVVERRLADERQLHLAVDAADRAQQHVVGVVVGGHAPVRVRALAVVVPWADQQDVADDDPAAARAPAGLEHHRAGQVAARRRHLHAGRAQPEDARVTVEHRAEDARRVHARETHPLDSAARRHERSGLAVGQERVVGDRRKRAPREALAAQCVDHRSGSQPGEPNGGPVTRPPCLRPRRSPLARSRSPAGPT